jgi:hypothetical protein
MVKSAVPQRNMNIKYVTSSFGRAYRKNISNNSSEHYEGGASRRAKAFISTLQSVILLLLGFEYVRCVTLRCKRPATHATSSLSVSQRVQSLGVCLKGSNF